VRLQGLVIEEIFLLSELFTSINTSGIQLIADNLTQFLKHITSIVDREGENLQEKTWQQVFMDFQWEISMTPTLHKVIDQAV